jgi:hypothetical protein
MSASNNSSSAKPAQCDRKSLIDPRVIVNDGNILVGYDSTGQNVYAAMILRSSSAKLSYRTNLIGHQPCQGYDSVKRWVNWLQEHKSGPKRKTAIREQYWAEHPDSPRILGEEPPTTSSAAPKRRKRQEHKDSTDKKKSRAAPPLIEIDHSAATDELFEPSKEPSSARYDALAKIIFKGLLECTKAPPVNVMKRIRDWRLKAGTAVRLTLCPHLVRWLLENEQHPIQKQHTNDVSIDPFAAAVLSLMPGCEGLVVDDDLGIFRSTPDAPIETNSDLDGARAAEMERSVELFTAILQTLLESERDAQDTISTWDWRQEM